LLTVTSWRVPPGSAVLEVPDAGPWAKPLGRSGVVTVVEWWWIVIGAGCPRVHGACWIVKRYPPMPEPVLVPPIPKFAIGMTPKRTLHEASKIRQIFPTPDRPMTPPAPLNEPAWFSTPTRLMAPPVANEGAPTRVVMGPKVPPARRNDER
jgi:hypothetical protein